MITNHYEGSSFNSTGLLVFLYKWRKALLLITAAGMVASVIVSYMIQPKFKSTVVMFPTTTSSISKSLLAENNNGKQDILQFGEEEEAEQMLQVLNSDEIRSRICQKYNLMKHYDIDSTDKYKRTHLYEEFTDNVNFKRTEFMSVKIEVLDQSPDTAAMIANDIAALLDTVQNRMLHERAAKAFRIVEAEFQAKLLQIKAMDDSLRHLNALGVYDYESQSEVVNEQYAIAISKGDQRAIKSLEEKLNTIAKYGSAYVAVRENLLLERKELSILRTKYNEAKVDAEQNLQRKFVVNNAYPAEKKSTPVRWLIVTVSTLSAFILAVLIVIAIENLSSVKGLNAKPRETKKGEKAVTEPVI
jgi:capsular polysaccharide biosynthesis protein